MKSDVCVPDRHVAQSVLRIADVWPIFGVLGAGLALSWVMLSMEHFVCNVKEKLCPKQIEETCREYINIG